MAVDRRIGAKVTKNLRREEAAGTRVDPYPYVGIVKNNLDPTRSGRLQVYIPDLGGDSEDKKNWRTVRYASPFMGYSNIESRGISNTFDTVAHTYGMWMVPPDIGVQVLCLFVAGDPQRGYWFACVNPYLSHSMIPGLAGSENVDLRNSSRDVQQSYTAGTRVPVVEFNESEQSLLTAEFYNNAKPVHEPQYAILKNQGLDRDPIRGSISSSSQRECPSYVFGISTPGRPKDDPADRAQEFTRTVNQGKLTGDSYKVKARKGGHTFVMDDGATLGQDQLVRLRSAKGHQILMHDSANSIYISHADGTSWVELTAEGAVKIYSKGGFSVRSEGTMNFKSEASINIEAAGSIKMKSGGGFTLNSGSTTLLQGKLSIESTGIMETKVAGVYRVDAAGKISVQSGGMIAFVGSKIAQNSGGTDDVKQIKPLVKNKLPNAMLNSNSGVWEVKQGALDTIVTVAPTHEPYVRAAVETFILEEGAAGPTPQTEFRSDTDATKSTAGTAVKNPAGDKDLRNQPDTNQTLGPLDKDQLKAYYAQIGKSESGGKYDQENSIGFIGKYQFGYAALIDAKYVKSTVKSNEELNNPNSWLGKDGIASKEDWLRNGTVQESAMEEFTARNYNTMIKNGAITENMTADEVGGMLAVAHLLGPNEGTSSRPGALGWRKGRGGSDAFGTSGDIYFQKGKFAVAVLAPKVPGIDAG